MTDPMAELWAKTRASLDQAVFDLIAVQPLPLPPKPFDLADLKRLAAQVDAIRPRWDRMVCAPDVVERLRAGSATAPPLGRPPFPLGTPIYIDEEMPMGHWELRDGDRKVDSPCRCESCQLGESRYDSRCGVCESIVEVDHGRIEGTTTWMTCPTPSARVRARRCHEDDVTLVGSCCGPDAVGALACRVPQESAAGPPWSAGAGSDRTVAWLDRRDLT